MTPPSDTHPEAEKVQIELLRKAGVRRRLEMCVSMTRTAIHQSRRAIAKAYPELSQHEQDLLRIRLYYGSELADQVREYLEQRSR